MTPHAQCGACVFFAGGDNNPKSPGEFAECKRFPPIVIQENGERDDARPLVHFDDWCGEYQRRDRI